MLHKDQIDKETLFEEYQKLSAVMEHVTTSVVLTDPWSEDNSIVFVNPAFTKLTQYTEEECLGRNCRFLQGEGTEEAKIQEIRDALEKHDSIIVELLNYKKDGSPFWNELRISPVYDEQDKLIYYIGLQLDVTERKEREAAIRYYASHDELTGLPNRKSLIDELESWMKEEPAFSIWFVDLNDFKLINDSYGHLAGDEVLKTIAARIQLFAEERCGFASRISGDEFVLVSKELRDSEGTGQMLAALRETIGRPIDLRSTSVTLRASIGLSTYPDDGRSFEELLRVADHAMYQEKREAK
ncbi:diguanylate cyclase domain-containing protein [Alkalicoccus chagannorensis]|uniref:diguanylate cyclase domain-containing protein n=1 Tax=Alkalicoccus chagannorensis TaxID=427072 RepID=UPI00040F132D|nr:diguanylate cyclase [Alkalicoccus chagannorensis]